MDPFLMRAAAAAAGLALVAAPLGSIVVWSRMAYFGETIAQASLIGVALALALDVDITLGVLAAAFAVALLIMLLSKQKVVPLDALLGLMHHGALALGVVATALLKGPSVDMMGYLFGDVFAVTDRDLVFLLVGGTVLLAVLHRLWEPLLRIAVHEELAAAEGIAPGHVRALFVAMLAAAIAFAIKIVGMLLAIAFLIVPVVAARPISTTPERMALTAAAIGVTGALAGLWLSATIDVPGGPAIVLVMSSMAAVSLMGTAYMRKS